MTNGEYTYINNNFQIIQGQITSVLQGGFAHYRTHPRSCAYKYFVQLWSRLIEKCVLYYANKVQNSNFQ